MARFSTTLTTAAPAAAAFDYLADFSTVAEWDPGVSSARRSDGGPLGIGSTFEVVAEFGPRRIPLTYVIKEWHQGHRVVLRAEHPEFTSLDTITVAPDGGGSAVTYDAILTLNGFRRFADPLLQAAFLVVGKRAEDGLRKALTRIGAVAA